MLFIQINWIPHAQLYGYIHTVNNTITRSWSKSANPNWVTAVISRVYPLSITAFTCGQLRIRPIPRDEGKSSRKKEKKEKTLSIRPCALASVGQSSFHALVCLLTSTGSIVGYIYLYVCADVAGGDDETDRHYQVIRYRPTQHDRSRTAHLNEANQGRDKTFDLTKYTPKP